MTGDKGASAVQLIHFTLKEYLSARLHIFRLDIFHRPHWAMAEIFLIHLNSKQVKDLSVYLHPGIPDAPFL